MLLGGSRGRGALPAREVLKGQWDVYVTAKNECVFNISKLGENSYELSAWYNK